MKSLLKLRTVVRPYLRHILWAILTLVGITGLSLYIPIIIREVIDVGLAQGEVNFMLKSGLVILGIGAVRAVLSFIQRYLSEYVSMNVAYDLRNRLYDHIQNLSFTYHDHAQTGQLMNRCTEDVRSMQHFIGTGFVELFQIFLIMIGAIGLMFTENSRLTLIALIPMIPLIIISADFGGRVSKLFYAIDKALGDLSARLQENVSGVQVVRAFTREPYEIDRFERTNRELYDARITVIKEWSKIMPTTMFLVSASTILILWYGGQMALAGDLTIGQVVQFNSYMLLIAMPVQQLTWFINSAGEASAGAQRVFEILDHTPIIKNSPNPIMPESISGQVKFKEVCFAFQGEPEHALKNITFEAQPNQIVALIGATGSGKTSLVNLIARFYDASEGEILIDGHDIRDLDLVQLRRQIGIVLQTSLLFSDSIRDNIAFGRPEASEEEIIAAAKAAQAHEFILNFPKGYGTIVGERGITLSGGQRQRIAIARALLIDPRILILDDSTSSVDTETEHLIQKALDSLMEGRTTFVIAQRLSTVRNADLILVLDGGAIVERGKHSDLLKADGFYREIYDLQLTRQEQFKEEMDTLDTSGEAE